MDMNKHAINGGPTESPAGEGAPHYGAIVVGAGFGGLYALKKLKCDLGLETLLLEQGGGVGGTWYWNRYPGAMSDTRSHLYCYSFDKELLQEDSFANHYRYQPEVRGYLEAFVDRYGLRGDIKLQTQVTGAQFDEAAGVWTVRTAAGKAFTCRYLITALGVLSKINFPNIDGIDRFKGELIHTGRWPEGASCKGKRVGIIGTGSTGVQVVTAVAAEVESLTVFQRSAQYSVPAGDGPMSDEFLQGIKENYEEIWRTEKNTLTAFGAKESDVPAMSVSAEERERVFEDAWQEGGGFRFMFGTFSDIITDEAANEAAADFIRRKIAKIVKDPVKAAKLTPTDYYVKRPLCDAGYYQQFNRPNVDVVDIKNNPIREITEKGVLTEDGVEHELDMLIFATGFDACDGNYLRMDIRGKGGLPIQDLWRDGARSYLGVIARDFPNMFMLLGPNSPFSNIPPALETQVDLIGDLVHRSIESGGPIVEVGETGVEEWVQHCTELANGTLLTRSESSWFFGANIPGKPFTVIFYMGGLKGYRQILSELAEADYPALTFSPAPSGAELDAEPEAVGRVS